MSSMDFVCEGPPETHSQGWRSSIRNYKRPLRKGSGEIPIPFLSEKSPTLESDNWCLITTQEVTI